MKTEISNLNTHILLIHIYNTGTLSNKLACSVTLVYLVAQFLVKYLLQIIFSKNPFNIGAVKRFPCSLLSCENFSGWMNL